MLDRFLGFGLTAGEERAFREAHLPADVSRVRVALLLVTVPILAFGLNDYAFLGLTWKFYVLAAGRIAVIAWAVALRAALTRVKSPAAYDRACFAWSLGLVALLVVVNAGRPQALTAHVVVAMAVVFLFSLVLPMRFRSQVALCFVLTAGESTVFALVSRPSAPTHLGAPGALLLMSALALEAGWQLHSHRRREFLAREALRRSNEQLEREVADRTRKLWRAVDELDRFFTLSPDLLCITDLEGRLRRVNRAWESVLGYGAKALEGVRLTDLAHADDAATTRAALEVVARPAGVVSFSNRCRAADGSYRWFDWHAANAQDSVHAVARDATERRRLEAQLRQSQKLEAIGRLAGGVAHNFNNQLTAILGSSELILEEHPAEAPIRQEATEIRDAARRAASLTRQLLAFSRRQVVRPRVLDLGVLVAGMEQRLRRLTGERVLLELRTASSPGRVRADPAQLEQAIEILVANACDAMPGGGRLVIELASTDVEAPETSRELGLPVGRYARVTVSDTGAGMSAEVQAHLFEPFFTTKEVGKGDGLGLSTLYGTMKQAGGEVRVRSEPGEGSAFDLYLPIVAEAAEVRGEPELARAKGTETVLLVEDEPLVRTLMARTLRNLGYQVLEAGDGNDALRVAEGHVGDIDLVVSDVVMPRMAGTELADLVRRARPGIEVLLISGFAERASAAPRQSEPAEPPCAFLQKPFVMAEFARTVRTLLDGHRKAPAPGVGAPT